MSCHREVRSNLNQRIIRKHKNIVKWDITSEKNIRNNLQRLQSILKNWSALRGLPNGFQFICELQFFWWLWFYHPLLFQ